MRWSIIRLIWLRELRDQLRDRRTLFMIAVLPLLLYPVLGFAVLQFALSTMERPSVIGIVVGPRHSTDFPEPTSHELVQQHLAWLTLTPVQGFPENAVSAVALASASYCPPLFHVEGDRAEELAGSTLADLQATMTDGKISPELVSIVLIK